jgi:hypothetical protein
MIYLLTAFGSHPVAAVQYIFGSHPVAVVQYTFTQKQNTEQHKTSNTQNNTKILEV